MHFHLGVVGKRGSGKTLFCKYLSEKYGYEILRFSDILKEIAKQQYPDKEITKKFLQDFGLKMKKEYGKDFLAKKILEKVEEGKKYVFDGLRELEEFFTLKKRLKILLIYIHADDQIRFQRLKKRDNINFENFKIADSHPVEKNIEKFKDMAEFVLINNFSKSEEFYKKIDELMEKIKKL